MFQFIKHFLFPALSVDTIVRDFNKSIEELKRTEAHMAEQIKQKEAEKMRLVDETAIHLAERIRATSIRTKIEQLIA